MDFTQDQFNALLRQDLAFFIARTFDHLDPQTPYASNWHIELLADRLTQVFEGKLRRLIITVPPRSLKSICASVSFPAWALGRNPALRFVCASYGQDLAVKLARDTLAVMGSPWYQRAFDTRVANRAAAYDFETNGRGGRRATSVGGVLTGLGGDIVIIDDPVKPDEALSDVQREAANTWFDNTLYSRLNNKKTGAIVIIMQRLHLDDLVGHVLEKEPWEVINLPAIAAEDEHWSYNTPYGPRAIHRLAGQPLHPEREGLEELTRLRSTMGEYAFAAQYLQSPVPMGGALVKEEWLHFYERQELPESFDSIVQSWDTANKVSELSDYSVCTTWGVRKKKAYLLHRLRKRLEYPELKRAVVEQATQWKATAVLIEDKASGTQLIQELRATDGKVHGIKSEGDKSMRMLAQTAAIENGHVLFPKDAPWLGDYLHELLAFPMAKYDDQVDSTSQALKWISDKGQEPAYLVFMRRLIAEEAGLTEDELVYRVANGFSIDR